MSGSEGRRRWRAGVLAVLTVGLAVGIGWYAYDSWKAVRSNNGDARVVVSPWIEHPELQRRDDVLFEAVVEEPIRWRLATLSTYEGGVWTISGVSDDVGDGVLGSGPPSPEAFVATVEVSDLSSIWLPIPPLSSTVTASGFGLGWLEAAGTLTVSAEHGWAQPGDTYSIGFEPATAARVGTVVQRSEGDAGSVDQRYLDQTRDPEILALVSSIGSGFEDPSDDAATAVERLVGHFGDSYAVDPTQNLASVGDSGSLGRFLAAGSGSELDAVTAFAQLARHLGVPSRVAVGFGPGETVTATSDGRLRQQVRGTDAIVWPEVFLDGVGWVAVDLG